MNSKELADILEKNNSPYVARSYLIEKLDSSEEVFNLILKLPNMIDRQAIIKTLRKC